MKKIFLFLTIFLIFFSAQTNPVKAEFSVVAAPSAVPKNRLSAKQEDPRIERLQAYLEKHQSPLAEYAACFIQTADKYDFDQLDLDYLVPAITGVESTFGKFYPQGSYNAYGWANGNYRWNSWEESIDHVSRVLKEKYIDQGADNVWKIGPIYAASPAWASKVTYFIKEINSFEAELPLTI
jgi:hypothetical protein